MKKFLFTLSLILLLFAPSIFAETVADIPAGTAEEYYNRGNAFEKQGNLTQAISDYTNAIRVYSKHAKAYYNRGKANAKQGNLSQAIADYNKAIEINPKYTEAYYNLGNAYEKLNNLAQAIASYNKAIENNPKYAAAYCNRGNAYQALGNLQQAVADYNKAIEIKPDFAGAYSNRGNAYQTQGNLGQAIADYNKAITLKPDFAGFYANRGNIYQTQGNLQLAIADYNKAIEKNPDDSSSIYNRGLAYYGIEQYGNSLADYSKAIKQNPNKEAYDDFIKYFPAKKSSDTGNVRNTIVLAFEEKLGRKTPVAVAAPVAPSVDVAVPVAAAVTITNLAQADAKQNEAKSSPKEEVRNLVTKWLTSWRSGDMKTYRNCYDESEFQSKGMNLDAWISYKANVRKSSKNIQIKIDNLQISADENIAKAVFTQEYKSSMLQDKGKKTLELRKTGSEWKIYKEYM